MSGGDQDALHPEQYPPASAAEVRSPATGAVVLSIDPTDLLELARTPIPLEGLFSSPSAGVDGLGLDGELERLLTGPLGAHLGPEARALLTDLVGAPMDEAPSQRASRRREARWPPLGAVPVLPEPVRQ